MKTVFERTVSVPALTVYRYNGPGGSFEIAGPGEVYIRGREFVERRTGAATRRARGRAYADPRARRLLNGGHGRRAGDSEAHRDRRDTRSQLFSVCNVGARWAQGLPTRRKTDDRRVKANAFRPTKDNILGQVRHRRKTDDRRDPRHRHGYASSRDPRIRALDRRVGLIIFKCTVSE